MRSNIQKTLLAAAAFLGTAFLANAQSTNLGAGNTNFGNFSLASGGFNTIFGGFGNHALGWSHTIGTGSFNLLAGLQNVTAGDFNFITGRFNQPAGAMNLVGGDSNVGTGSLNLVFGVFVNAGATAGKVILTDSNPLIPTAVRSATNRFTPAGADRFVTAFNEGYFLNTNSLQGANAGAGLVIIPSVANTATTSSPAFVGINTATQARLPAQALDVVGNGIFTGNVTTGTVGAGTSTVTIRGVNGTALVNSGFAPGGGTTLMATFTGAAAGPQLRFARTTGGTGFWDIGEDGNNNFVLEANDTALMTVLQDGSVGIGTPTPTQAKFVVNGFVTNAQTTGTFFQSGSTALVQGLTGHSAYSIFATNRIAADSFDAISDARIKQIEGRSDAAGDLNTLMKIEVTNYKFKDTLTKGDRSHKKVIAQQVEQVYPQAVHQLTDVVPDIYQKAEVKGGWVQLATDLKAGERVRLIGEKKEGIHEVLEVKGGSFRTGFQPETDKVFVYGREVKDFRTVDYEAISMLNVSATQELVRKVEAKDAEIARLTARLAALEAKDQAREARLARLEAAGSGKPARAVRASLDLKASNQ